MKNPCIRCSRGLAMLSAAFMGLAAPACNQRDGQDIGQAKRTAEFYGGMYVTVMGELENKAAPNLFKISNDELFEDELWVVAPGGQAEELSEDDEVLITGTMKQISGVELERELGMDLDESTEAEFDERVIMIADQISVLQDTAALDGDAFGIDNRLEEPSDGELFGEQPDAL